MDQIGQDTSPQKSSTERPGRISHQELIERAREESQRRRQEGADAITPKDKSVSQGEARKDTTIQPELQEIMSQTENFEARFDLKIKPPKTQRTDLSDGRYIDTTTPVGVKSILKGDSWMRADVFNHTYFKTAIALDKPEKLIRIEQAIRDNRKKIGKTTPMYPSDVLAQHLLQSKELTKENGIEMPDTKSVAVVSGIVKERGTVNALWDYAETTISMKNIDQNKAMATAYENFRNSEFGKLLVRTLPHVNAILCPGQRLELTSIYIGERDKSKLTGRTLDYIRINLEPI